MDALVSGATPDQMEVAAYGADAVTPATSEDNSDSAQSQDDGGVDAFFNNPEESTEQPPKEEGEEKPTEALSPEALDVEEVEAGGAKIKIDYKDKKAIKDAHLKAAGMRKFQRERDEARKQLKEKESKLVEQQSLWGKIEEAASKNDYNELMKIMTGGKTDFDTLLKSRMERAKLIEETPEEDRVKFYQEDEISQLKSTVTKQSQEIEKLLNKVKAEKEEIETKSVQSRINPAFEKYRFAGKLGNSAAEHKLDKMIWNDALASLEELGLDESELTSEIIEKEFKAAAELLGSVTKQQAAQATKQISQQRQKEAQEAAQLQQVKGYVGSNVKKEAAEKIRSGDLTSIFKNWGKYKDVF